MNSSNEIKKSKVKFIWNRVLVSEQLQVTQGQLGLDLSRSDQRIGFRPRTFRILHFLLLGALNRRVFRTHYKNRNLKKNERKKKNQKEDKRDLPSSTKSKRSDYLSRALHMMEEKENLSVGALE